MTEKIKLVQGDTRPALVCTITDDVTGAAINITGAAVALKFRASGSTTLQAIVPGAVTNGGAGQVAFYPASNPAMLNGMDGDYEGEIEITFADGQIQTVYELLKFKVRQEF
ncbi:MAG: hypothetical protein HQ446_06240 [Polaromonas sp.]|nr:hypothetical protein [Polaromonas sp.]